LSTIRSLIQPSSYHNYCLPKFTVYYFDEQALNAELGFLNCEYAYKNKFIVLHGKDDDINQDSGSEIHEMTHIILYGSNYSVFLFREGIPCLLAEKIVSERILGEWNPNTEGLIAVQQQINWMDILKKVNRRQEDQVYYDCATILIKKLLGMSSWEHLFEAYRKINYSQSDESNFMSFEYIFKISYDDLINNIV